MPELPQRAPRRHFPIRTIWTLSAGILFLAALLPVLKKTTPVIDLSRQLGIAMLITGGANLVVCSVGRTRLHGMKWILADGITTVLLSLFPLFNEMIIPSMIPFFFGIWELFSGILKSMDAAELKGERVKAWRWFSVFGGIEVFSGVAALIKPIEEFAGMNTVISTVFFIQSCNYATKSVFSPQLLAAPKT